ncbi:MAG TPA: hypothetical protein VIE46_06500 [Gemmatimonadales bacterium]
MPAGIVVVAGGLLPASLAGQSAGRLQVEARVVGAEGAWEGLALARRAVLLAGAGQLETRGESRLADVRLERWPGGVVVTIEYLRN